ncbi:MAG: hypothetical protein CVV14_09070 [Gammaproteobacteria bacterium HGW-Gammaproteobacteria-4]|jgi:thiol:disulfide interchange protein DsbA|nr:MAG: hypothetical protein CVV14_09070 [Gammaproteobacteria bacterium HGW-Gammaproteobacteria-4]
MIRRMALLAIASLLPIAALAQTGSDDSTPQEGREFTTMASAQPMAPVDGKIEVVEVFSYACIHCANFEPYVKSWKKDLPQDVNFIYMPMSQGGSWEAFGRAFYAAESMGLLDKTHEALFKAVHIDKRPFTSLSEIAGFYKDYGVDPKVFESTMQSFAVNAKINRARQLAPRWMIQGTPSLVVAGKYRVMASPVSGLPGMLKTAEYLIDRERAAAKAAQATAAK